MRTLLKGGTVVSGTETRRADILIEGEKILAVGRSLGTAERTVDVGGCLLLPGFIDGHTHFELSTAGVAAADDFTSGSQAALKGGTTTVLDYVCPERGETLHHALELWRQRADGRTYCDYGFHMTINDWNESIRSELPDLFAKGISSFKIHMADPSLMIGDQNLYWALKSLRSLGGICGVHCENAEVIEGMISERVHAGQLGPAAHALTRPAILEAEAVSRLLRIAQIVGCAVIITSLSSAEALSEVERARERGQQVYVETCPQYLLLDEEAYFHPDAAAAACYVCTPPLRDRANHAPLWRALRRDEIQTVSSAHCAFTPQQKAQPEFTKIPRGLPGVENRGELLYSYGVAKKRITLNHLCRLLCENPARLYGLFPRKGVLRPGSDADIVVYDPGNSHVIRAEDSLSRAGYNPYEGFVTAGGIHQVYLRGRLCVENGAVLPQTPEGLYLSRGKRAL